MQTFTVKTKKAIYGGSCISDIDGKTVFIPYALPGETLEISILKEHKNYIDAKIETILTPSPERIKPECPYFYLCGGCNLQMASGHSQRQMRKEAALEALIRAGVLKKTELKGEFIVGNDWEYRSRFQFSVDRNKLFAQKKGEVWNLFPLKTALWQLSRSESF